ncbi:MAG: hypothetical protein WBO53_07695 [Thermoanaerobaculia bacterium]
MTVCVGYTAVEVYLLNGQMAFPLDDSWIHLQFARNLAAGEGLAFNPGKLVAGSTAPLWTALVSLAYFLPGNPVFWVKLLGVLLFLVGGWVTFRLGLELALPRSLAMLAALLTVSTSWLVWSALSGLEIPLFVVLSLVAIELHLEERRDEERPPLSLLVMAIAALVRPEAILLMALAVVDRLVCFERDSEGDLVWRRPGASSWWLVLLGIAVVLVPMALFNWSVSGSVLPTTFSAKTPGMARWLPEMRFLHTVLGIFFKTQPFMLLLAGAGVLTMVGRLGGDKDRGLLPALWLVCLPLAYSLMNPAGGLTLVGNLGRYLFPLFPLLNLLGVLGLQRILGRFSGRVRVGNAVLSVRAVLLSILILPTVASLVQGAGRYAQGVMNVQDSDVKAAHWLQGRLNPKAILAVNDIGAIKYILPNRVVDLAGIISPEVRELGHNRFLDFHQPDFLVVFPRWFPTMTASDSPFDLVKMFPIQNNITMGGDELGVYSTPWTRYPLREDRP